MTVDSSKSETFEGLRRVPCEVYSRIVGYLRPVRDWNRGKQQEFSERKVYDLGAVPPADVIQEFKS
jgi:hypothetical protein